MEDKVYILTNGEDQDIKSKIYGVYESENDAMKAKEHLCQYFQFTEIKESKIIQVDVNPYLDLVNVAIMEFEVNFDKVTMAAIMPNYPERINVYHQIDRKKHPDAPRTYSMVNTIALDQVILNYNHKDKSDDSSTHFLTAKCKIIIDDLKSKHEIFMTGRNLILKELKNQKIDSFPSMIDKISIELDPSYNFLTNKIDLLKIYVDDILAENYARILIDIFKQLMTNYREKLLSVLGDYTDECEKIEKGDYINRKEILSQIKSQCEQKLLKFNWYKENPSLNNGLKEFMINGNKAFA